MICIEVRTLKIKYLLMKFCWIINHAIYIGIFILYRINVKDIIIVGSWNITVKQKFKDNYLHNAYTKMIFLSKAILIYFWLRNIRSVSSSYFFKANLNITFILFVKRRSHPQKIAIDRYFVTWFLFTYEIFKQRSNIFF